jgi:hypothetical protein
MANKQIREKRCVIAMVFFAGFIALLSGYAAVIASINREHYPVKRSEVAARQFPYPYQAALAISNDIDNTSTFEEFVETHKFLNTHEKTSMGEGVGLNIGNTFLFWEPPSGKTISFFGSSDPRITKTIMKYLRAGQIDIIHSYGQKPNFARADMIAALQELRKDGIYLDTWIDHSGSHSNMGDDVTFGLGDHLEAAEYHADLTLASGVKYAWLGRVTMIVGQAAPLTWNAYLNLFDSDHPFYSGVNISKEWAKNIVAILGSKKYSMHKDNELVHIATLDDGAKIYEFMRFDDNWRGVGAGADSRGLAYSISPRTLARLKEVEGYMIVYTHLGKNSDCEQYICPETQAALRNLADEYRSGRIFVTTTSNLLNYHVRHKYLNWSYNTKNGEIKIVVHAIDDPIFGSYVPSIAQLEGMTFYVPDGKQTFVYLGESLISTARRNEKDHTGRESITIVSAAKKLRQRS